jgi:hypothetical protein
MRKSYVLAFQWNEPQRDCSAIVASLLDKEMAIVNSILHQLNNAGDGGEALVYWHVPVTLADENTTGGMTFKNTLRQIATESRYDECSPGEPYGSYYNNGDGLTIPELDAVIKKEA